MNSGSSRFNPEPQQPEPLLSSAPPNSVPLPKDQSPTADNTEETSGHESSANRGGEHGETPHGGKESSYIPLDHEESKAMETENTHVNEQSLPSASQAAASPEMGEKVISGQLPPPENPNAGETNLLDKDEATSGTDEKEALAGLKDTRKEKEGEILKDEAVTETPNPQEPDADDIRQRSDLSNNPLEQPEVVVPKSLEVNNEAANMDLERQSSTKSATSTFGPVDNLVNDKEKKPSLEDDSCHKPETKKKADKSPERKGSGSSAASKRLPKEPKIRRSTSGSSENSKATKPPNTSPVQAKKLRKKSTSTPEALDLNKAGSALGSSGHGNEASGDNASGINSNNQASDSLELKAEDPQSERPKTNPRLRKGPKRTEQGGGNTPKLGLEKESFGAPAQGEDALKPAVEVANSPPLNLLDPNQAMNTRAPDRKLSQEAAKKNPSKSMQKVAKGTQSKVPDAAKKSKSSSGGQKSTKQLSPVSSGDKVIAKAALSVAVSSKSGKKIGGKSQIASATAGDSDRTSKGGPSLVLAEDNPSEMGSPTGPAAKISVHTAEIVRSRGGPRSDGGNVDMSQKDPQGIYAKNAGSSEKGLLQSCETYTVMIDNASEGGSNELVDNFKGAQFSVAGSAGIALNDHGPGIRDCQLQHMKYGAVSKFSVAEEGLEMEINQNRGSQFQSSSTSGVLMGSLAETSAEDSRSGGAVRVVGSSRGMVLDASAQLEGNASDENSKAKMVRTRLDAAGNIIDVVEISAEEAALLSQSGKIVKEDSTEHVVVNEGKPNVEMTEDGGMKISTPIEVVKTVQKMRVREKVVQKMVEISESETDSETED